MQLSFDEQKLQFKLHSLEKSSRGLQALQLNHGRPLSHLPPLLNQMHVSPLELLHSDKSLKINIDSTAMKELLRLTQTNEPLWIKTDRCLDVLSLKSYETAFPRFSILTLVEMLMDSVKARELFPSVVAASKTIGVVSSRLHGNHGDALHLTTT
ncbi:hypothetical protein HID58_061700 [Brassica napus]|uniref:START domain-containing protein n=1 Tax=Brassica napus TaxID=3708 RepID=A0ABQ7ZZB9_BRANA|nr:hypothetical protein HID58_061700 [Brassica napus]